MSTYYENKVSVTSVKASGDVSVDALLYGTKWDDGMLTLLRYSFPGQSSFDKILWTADYVSLDGEPFKPEARGLSADEQKAVEKALDQWESVSNLFFLKEFESDQTVGDLRFAATSVQNDAQAWAYFPTVSPVGGDVWFNLAANWDGFSPGSYGYLTVLHEIGHALGLSHPFQGGLTTLPQAEDSYRNTVMSYSAYAGSVGSYVDFNPTTLMPYDIKAVQYLYGSGYSNARNNEYIYLEGVKYNETIYDTGGVDKIVWSSIYESARIDLRPGAWSDLGASLNYYSNAGVAIAASSDTVVIYDNCIIENACGGGGGDEIVGNGVANWLEGKGGADTLAGDAGNDTLDGGEGADTLDGGSGDDLYFVDSVGDIVQEQLGGGVDHINTTLAAYTLAAEIEQLTYTGTAAFSGTANASNNKLSGGAGHDTLQGLAGNDTLLGFAGNDRLDGGSGDDSLEGGAGDDVYVVDAVGDIVKEVAAGGRDRIETTLTNYTLGSDVEQLTYLGNADFIGVGQALSNVLIGGAGNDSLIGGAGIDSLIGGGGNDVFVVDVAGDVVVEEAGEGTDLVKVGLSSGAYVLSANVENAEVIGAGAAGVTGNDLDNKLTGNAAANVLTGGAGNDTLDGGAGADALFGGVGDDLYTVDVDDAVTEKAGEGKDQVVVRNKAGASYVLGANLEDARFEDGALAMNLTGNAAGNWLGGNDGHNVLNGLAGNDSLAGLAGNDTLDGGAGNDLLEGGAGDDVYKVDSLDDVVQEVAGEGADRVDTALARYTLAAEVEQLSYIGTTAFAGTGNGQGNKLTGGAGSDTLQGLAGNDTLLGLAGNDRLDGGEGDDSLEGGAGDDVYVIDSQSDQIREVAAGGTDRIETALTSYTLGTEVEQLTYTGIADFTGTGQALNNALTGGVGNDTLNGLAGNDTLNGGLGNDVLDGGVGSDALIGGAGDDQYLVDVTTDVVSEKANEGTDTVRVGLGVAGTYTLTDNVENASVVSATGVTVNVSGNAVGNALQGHDGTNVLNGQAGDDTLTGLGGNDTLDGGVGNDTLQGGSGNDSLQGGVGADLLDGGTGADTVDGGADSDVLVLSGAYADYAITRVKETETKLAHKTTGDTVVMLGVETVRFSDGDKSLAEVWNNAIGNYSDAWTGTDGNDTVDGLAGNDTLNGGAGDDSLIGGAGIDSLIGGGGNDVFVVDVAGDVVVEEAGEGTDLVKVGLSSGTYVLSANVENAEVIGAGATGITGNDLDNKLTGNAAANVLTGGAGNDTLDGGAGADALFGGVGDDEYRIDTSSDTVNEVAGPGIDTVKVGYLNAGTYTLTANVENAEVLATTNAGMRIDVTGNVLDNILIGHAGANALNGGDGNDTLYSKGGNDTLDGGLGGKDVAVLEGAQEDYAITRPSATQTLFTHIASGTVISVSNVEGVQFSSNGASHTLASLIAQIGSPGNDTLLGNSGDDTLSGQVGNDLLQGGEGHDDLQGGIGNDTLDGGVGNDLLDGGAGNDVYRFAIGGGDDIIDQNDSVTGTVDIIEIAAPVGDVASGDTQLTRGWDSYDDLVITLKTGNPEGEVIDHIVVNDFFNNDLLNLGTIDQLRFASNATTFSQAQILAELLKGTNDADWLRGYANTHDSINGAGGDDTIGGAAGNDTLRGGQGNDQMAGDVGNDLLNGESGHDLLLGGDGLDTLEGGMGNDTLSGGSGNDTYTFGLGFGVDRIEDNGLATDLDVLRFTAGVRANEVTVARRDDDLKVTLKDGSTAWVENFFAADSTDTIEQFSFADGSSWTAIGVRAKVVVPTTGDDEITGYLGSESLQGLAGNDTLNGGAGNDTLNGGVGDDVLIGGAGADRFVFNHVDALVNPDLIEDFTSGADSIALSASVFGGLGSVGSKVGLSDKLLYDAGSGALSYDADGVGGADAVVFAHLGTSTHPATLAQDFLIVA